jgi:hypothetical protein
MEKTMKQSPLRVMLLFLLTGSLLLTGCNLPKPNSALTPTGDAVSTAAAETVAAFSTQMAVQTTVTPQPAAATSTFAPLLPTNTQMAAVNTVAPSATSAPCDRAEFVSDVTIPDGTDFDPGESFTKTWRIKNTGSCTWSNSYRVVFDSGNALGAPASFNLPSSVAPGSTIDLSVSMKAPDSTSAKSYESYWKLQNASGVTFGLGADGSKSFWVKIDVGSSAPAFAVTSVQYDAEHTNVEGQCPYTFKVSASITTSAAGKITYYWERSDGIKSETKELKYDAGGTQKVTYEFQLSSSYDGWVRLYNDTPNHQTFSNFNIKLVCTP